MTVGKDLALPFNTSTGYLEFEKMQGRDWLPEPSTTTGTPHSKKAAVDFTEYLPNSIRRKIMKQKRSTMRDTGIKAISGVTSLN